MAGLGAGAGAFSREQEIARQNAEAARLHEQRRQFNASQRARKEEQKLARLDKQNDAKKQEDRFKIERQDKLDLQKQTQQNLIDQRRTEKEKDERELKFKLEDRKIDADKRTSERERLEKKDAWEKVLNEEKLEAQRKQKELYQDNLDRATALFKQEQEALAQRKFITQTQVAAALTLMRQNNGAVPASHLPALSEVIGVDVQGAWDDRNGNLVIAVATGEQDEAGNPVVVQNPIPIADIEKFMESVIGVRQNQAAFEQAAALKGRGRAPSGQQSGEEGFDRAAAVKQADWLLKEASRFEEAGDLEVAKEYRDRADDLSAQVAGVNLNEARKSGAQRFLDGVSDRQSDPTNEEVAKIDSNIAKARDRLRIAPIEQREALQKYIATQEKLRKQAEGKARKPTRMESFYATVGPM